MEKKQLYKEILQNLNKGKEYRIAFIGDSISSAEWVHPNWRDVFEYILKFSFEEFTGENWWIPEWNLKFYNYSLDGASTKNFIEMAQKSKEEVNPDLYIVMGTSNDVELGIQIEDHIKNLTKMFEIVGSGTVIYSPNISTGDENINKEYRPYVDASLKIDTKDSVIKINGFEIFNKYPTAKFYTLDLDEIEITSGQTKDLVHPNALGNIYIAKMFLEECFGIEVNPERYLADIRSDIVKYPRW